MQASTRSLAIDVLYNYTSVWQLSAHGSVKFALNGAQHQFRVRGSPEEAARVGKICQRIKANIHKCPTLLGRKNKYLNCIDCVLRHGAIERNKSSVPDHKRVLSGDPAAIVVEPRSQGRCHG